MCDNTKNQCIIKKYTMKHKFMDYDIFEQKSLNYSRFNSTNINRFYYLVRAIYNNLDNDKIIVSKARDIYNLTPNRSLAFEYLQLSIFLINNLLEKSKNMNIHSYGRKLEFIYQDVCDDWDS